MHGAAVVDLTMEIDTTQYHDRTGNCLRWRTRPLVDCRATQLHTHTLHSHIVSK